MGIFGGKKKKDKENDMKSNVPVQEVINFRNQGMSNDQIINQLRAEGHEFQNIKDAMSQAELKGAISSNNMMPPQIPSNQTTPQAQDIPDFSSNSPETPSFAPAPGMEVKDRSVEEIERILEQIIEEKWADVEEKLVLFEKWKDNVEKEIEKINTRISDFKTRINSIEASITGKVEEYGKTMQDVNVEIHALEKVMGKLVPTLSDSIKELRGLVDKKREEKH